MTAIVPAWAEAFHQDVGAAPRLGLPHHITRRWAYGDGSGHAVRVAVVDSGVDATHPLVGGVDEAVVVERSRYGEVCVSPGPHDDLYGHGTACAAIIRSLAPAAGIVSVRVLGPSLKGNADTFAGGLEWSIEQSVQIVNLSLSTSNEQWAETFWELVDRAAFHNIMLVCAMNNERKRTIPSEFSGVFSVACAPGRDREQIWCNPQGPAEWGAAGIDVEVAWTGGTTVIASGNSFAAPVVAGHLARIVGAHPGITPWQARTVLAELAENRPRS